MTVEHVGCLLASGFYGAKAIRGETSPNARQTSSTNFEKIGRGDKDCLVILGSRSPCLPETVSPGRTEEQESPLKPGKAPRCHAYAYLTLLLCTTVLLYFYSYPLEMNSFNMKIASAEPSLLELEADIRFPTTDIKGSEEFQTHPVNITNITSTSFTATKDVSSVETTSFPINSTKISHSSNYVSPSTNTTTRDISNYIPSYTESYIKPTSVSFNAKSTSKKSIRTVSPKSFTTISSTASFRTNFTEVTKNVKKEHEIRQKLFKTEFEAPETVSTEKLVKSATLQSRENTKPSRTEGLTTSSQVVKNVVKDYKIKSKKSGVSLQVHKRTTEKSIRSTSFRSHESNLRNATSNTSSSVERYLVNSKSCKIPDIDPMHPSILEFVEITPPLSCQDEVPLTYTEGNTLFLNIAEIEKLNLEKFVCCYKALKRDLGKMDDNAVKLSSCRKFTDKVEIKDEFIEVKCTGSDGTKFYEEYYSFIHDKKDVEERCAQNNESNYSVLIIGIDAMSRMNMHRQMNRTLRYLLDDMQATEMFGFNKVGDNTFPNLVPLLLGYDVRELPQVCYNLTKEQPLDDCNFMWKRFAERGYRTLYAEDSPRMSSFNYVKEGFHTPPTDYYFRPFISVAEYKLGRDMLLNCYACLGSVSETEAVLSWTEKFASNFEDRPYFAFSWINSLTHDSLNQGSSGDHMYEKFFRTLHQSGALDRTIVIVMGDHGMRWGDIRKTYIGRLEERLPILLIALPEDFKSQFPKETKAIETNSHRLVTPFDLHATLDNILHLKEEWKFRNPDNVSVELAHNFTKRAKSLFRPVPEDRSCDDAWIDEHWCTCEASLPINKDHDDVKKAARFLVKELNYMLKTVRNVCAKLVSQSIVDARVWSPNSEHSSQSVADTILTIIVRTLPGDAVFEATVRVPTTGKPELLGAVSRLNLYGNQSECVQDAVLKKYCFCL